VVPVSQVHRALPAMLHDHRAHGYELLQRPVDGVHRLLLQARCQEPAPRNPAPGGLPVPQQHDVQAERGIGDLGVEDPLRDDREVMLDDQAPLVLEPALGGMSGHHIHPDTGLVDLDSLAEHTAQEYVLGRLRPEHFAAAATRLLVAGADADEVAVAAMPDTRDPREIRELFETALDSLGVVRPTWEQAVKNWLWQRACAVATGQATLDDVAAQIRESCAWPADVDHLPAMYQQAALLADNQEDAELSWWIKEFTTTLTTIAASDAEEGEEAERSDGL